MNDYNLSVREIETSDIDLIADYWLNSDPGHLKGMGVDLDKLPTREQWSSMLLKQIETPLPQKNAYCIIWLENGKPVGHCNTNPASFGQEANMHLHLWNSHSRKKGMGSALVRLTLPFFFENLQLKKLICEPYALNPAPNKTMEKLGFDLVKEYITIPGSLNFEQPVKRWEMTVEKFRELIVEPQRFKKNAH